MTTSTEWTQERHEAARDHALRLRDRGAAKYLDAALDEIERLDGCYTRACMEIGELRQRQTVTVEMYDLAAQAMWDKLRELGGKSTCALEEVPPQVQSRVRRQAMAAVDAALGVKG